MAIVNLTNAHANELLMSVVNDIDADGTAGTVKVYTTPMPSSPDDAATGTLLSEHNLSYPCIATTSFTSAPSWTGGSATYTATGHGQVVDDRVVVTNSDVSGYNGEFTIATVPDANTFTVVVADPGGAPTATGEYKAVSGATLTFDTIADDTSANAGGDPAWARIADNSGDDVVDVDAGVGSEFLVFNTGTISINANVAIDSLTLTV